MIGKRVIELTEYVPRFIARAEITESEGEKLYRAGGSAVSIDFPSPNYDWKWRLTSLGWVGHIPATPDLWLRLNPKVPLGNLFRMLEYAYKLRSLQFLNALAECASVEDYYEGLANVLAKRILNRGRIGFYKSLIGRAEPLGFVRGRLDLRSAHSSWNVKLHCRYEEHTSDIEDNQILAWTLWSIAHSGVCSDRTLPTIRRAFRSLEGFASLLPASPADCIGRLYNRLNDDYQPLHALCRFFLEHCGPTDATGDHSILPFLVDMNRLFELFVAEWLKAHTPEGFVVKAQERVSYAADEDSHFAVDLVLHSLQEGIPVAVLDTKYKSPASPASDDVAQVVAYAESLGCQTAMLVYPADLAKPLDTWIGRIRVRSLTYSLADDLERAGGEFLQRVMSSVAPVRQ
jgi:5-methylcytosine-specific restriction enzyme subunit McrC